MREQLPPHIEGHARRLTGRPGAWLTACRCGWVSECPHTSQRQADADYALHRLDVATKLKLIETGASLPSRGYR